MPPFSFADVTIREVPPTPVATMTHAGDPATIAATVSRFIAWRQANGLFRPDLPIFGLFPTDTRATTKDEFRMQICVGTDQPIGPNDDGVEAGLIPGGRVAVLRVLGTAGDDLEPPALFLYRDWLPRSGEELRDFPLYCQRVRYFPIVPAHEAVTDLFLPLR
jgi:AraC family transcriptional regulator